MSVATNSAAARGIKKQVSLPMSKAIEFAWKSVRIRFMRSLITAGGIFLGIAFLASILVDKAVQGPNIEASDAARLNWLVALSLAVCVVGITNSMLMSVTERFREIGTMKCLGALSQFIVKIFMIEAIAMGAIASSMGWLVGTLLMVATKMLIGVPKNGPGRRDLVRFAPHWRFVWAVADWFILVLCRNWHTVDRVRHLYSGTASSLNSARRRSAHRCINQLYARRDE